MNIAAKKKYESPRQLERQTTILSCARDMLEELGYTGMTMRGLAKRAGVAQGTLYNLYSSKDVLILAAVEDLLLEIGRRTQANPQRRDGLDSILRFNRASSEQVQSTPRYADAIARVLAGAYAGDPLVDLLYLRGLPLIYKHLEFAKQQGEVRPEVDSQAVAKHIVGQQWGVIWMWIMGLIDLADVVHERLRSDLMTLIAVATPATRARLDQELAALARSS